MSTRMEFSKGVLTELGITPNWRHIGARRALVAWMGPESGWYAPCDGVEGAAFNPLNTTLPVPGITSPHNYNVVPGVKNYLSFEGGIAATAATLKETRYDGVRYELARRYNRAEHVLAAVGRSDWGTFKTPVGTYDEEYMLAILKTYQSNRRTYNAVLMG